MRKLLIAAVALFAAAQTASAAAACGYFTPGTTPPASAEKITRVITHQDGNVYFSTTNKCKNAWCMLEPTSWTHPSGTGNGYTPQLAKQMAYEGLLSAFQNNYWVGMYFGTESDCTSKTTVVRAQFLEFWK